MFTFSEELPVLWQLLVLFYVLQNKTICTIADS